jgi:hypothetical protein
MASGFNETQSALLGLSAQSYTLKNPPPLAVLSRLWQTRLVPCHRFNLIIQVDPEKQGRISDGVIRPTNRSRQQELLGFSGLGSVT